MAESGAWVPGRQSLMVVVVTILLVTWYGNYTIHAKRCHNPPLP